MAGMKKLVILVLGCLLVSSAAFAGEATGADQKWLAAVEKMVAEGKTTVSTPKEERVKLLKDWAAKNGYSVTLIQNDQGFSVQLAKKRLASK